MPCDVAGAALMPLYVYKCPRCEALREDIRTIEERHDGPLCDMCIPVYKMELVLAPPMVIVKNPAAG